jgi:hypothetical protein
MEAKRSAVPAVRFGFGHDVDAPRRARQLMQQMFGDEHDPFTEGVQIAASELVTNVILHTGDGGELRAYCPPSGGPLRLEVEDRLPDAPAVRSPGPHESSGRGLRIVGDVSRAWGVLGSPSGKVVWAEFDRPA